MQRISNLQDLNKFNVNLEEFEQVKQTLYDSVTYPNAGANSLRFFQSPIGQGGKTIEDTNLTLAGQLPTNQLFLVECVELLFLPNFDYADDSTDRIAEFGAQQAQEIVNDAYQFRKAGALTFRIGSKDYLEEAPLHKFPTKTKIDVCGSALADATTAGSDGQSRIGYAQASGRPYFIDPPLLLIENQNFSVTLSWPNGVEALPSGLDAKVFCIFDGKLFRRAQ
jgi:hypothetical protein